MKWRRAVSAAAVVWWTLGCVSSDAAAPDLEPEPEPPLPGSITPNYPPVPENPEVDGAPLQDILNSETYIERLVTHLIGYETWVGLCTDAQPLSRKRTWVVTDPVPLPGADPVEGIEWMEIVELEGCNRTYERIVFATYVEGKPVFHVQLPGDSKAEPVLQHAAITALRQRQSEAAWQAGCQRADHARIIGGVLDDTWVPNKPGAWRELWSVHTCNGVDQIPVIFSPDAQGSIVFEFVE